MMEKANSRFSGFMSFGSVALLASTASARNRNIALSATEPAGMAPEKRLFAYSIIYLFALFGALVADRWIAL